jgi:hypothetical protein
VRWVAAIIASMPDETRSDETPSDETPDTPAAPEPKVSREVQQIPTPTPRWLAPAALLVAVVAVGLAIWALMSASSNAATATAGGKKDADPKKTVCTAFGTVSRAIPLQTHNDLGPDPVAQAAVAGNARLALFGGGVYLLNSLSPDTPSDLADPVRSFATALQDIGMNALAGVTNTDPAQSARLADADASRQQIAELCK